MNPNTLKSRGNNQKNLRKIEDEMWLPVPDTNNSYQVSNYGRVKSFVINKVEGKLLNPSFRNGSKRVEIVSENYKREEFVHKLVAKTWISKPSDDHNYVIHLDGNRKNNHVSNLEWHTEESIKAKRREIRQRNFNPKRKKLITNSKLKESDIRLLKSMLQKGVFQSEIAKMFCISEMQVTRIKRGENWGHIV
jgi:WD40 repeat protein